jgi:hypothetical protein
MPILINAIGAIGFGVFYGYLTIYIMKRYLPPISQTPPKIKDIVIALTTIAGGGVMGTLVRSIDKINYLGPYGIGLVVGAIANTVITIWFGLHQTRS